MTCNRPRPWALFHAGQFDRSQRVNDQLLRRRNSQIDLLLDINIAVAAGDWERLPAIVEREWRQHTRYNADILMTLAMHASQQGSSHDRALRLATLAVEKAPDTPEILAGAYGIHFRLGHDADADPSWLYRALKHSSQDEGPVWQTDLQQMVEQWLPRQRERSEKIHRMLLSGDIHIAFAAGMLNTPLSTLLLHSPGIVTDSPDGRLRPLLPIVSATRDRVEIKSSWIVGLDVTSVMVLSQLDLLDTAIESLHHVKITPDLMESLYVERAAVRFHQPARIEAAKQTRRLIDQNLIRVIDRPLSVAPDATEEFGEVLACTLEAARQEGGAAICVTPLHKAQSLTRQLADVSEYEELIFSPADLVESLHSQGVIDADQSILSWLSAPTRSLRNFSDET